MKKQEQLIFELLANLGNVFRNEENKNDIQISGKKITEEYFYALLQAFRLHFMDLIGDENMDLLDFIALLNRLSFQFLQASEDKTDEYKHENYEEEGDE